MQATVRVQHPTLICLLVFLPSAFLFLPYLATNKTKDEARRRRRKVRNHVQLDGYHSSLIALFGACPFDPSFWFVAIIGTAAQWSLGHQAATNACRWLAGAVQPRFLQPFIPSWAYPIPMVIPKITDRSLCVLPFWFVAIIGTAAQWSLGHQAATNACSQAFPHHL